MSFDHVVSLVSALIGFVGLVFVAVQIRANTRQRESDSLVKVYDINRQLLSLGFAYPQLFKVLDDATNVDPVWEKCYLQLWLNQLSLVHSYLKDAVFNTELKESLEAEIADFMTRRNMHRHWLRYGKTYPASFQKLVNGIIELYGPPDAAHANPAQGHDAKT